jgi:hypothetical protein
MARVQDFFEMIQVDGSGELHLRTSPDRNGEVLVSIELFDDGGTHMGGRDSSRLNFSLVVTPINTRPDFILPPTGLTAVCRDGNASLIHNRIHVVPFPLDEQKQQATFIILHISDESLFSGPLRVENDGSVSLVCASGSAGVAAVDLVLRDNGGSRTVGAQAPKKTICSSTDSVAPSCEVLVHGLPFYPVRAHDQRYSGFQIRVSVANTDFSDEDEFVSGVWIGNKMYDGLRGGNGSINSRHFMSDGRSGGYDSMCAKVDTILDIWLPAESEVFMQGPEPWNKQVRVRIKTSEAVGCCTCYGATLYAEISITPYLVPDHSSVLKTVDVWVVPQTHPASMRVPSALILVEQQCIRPGATHATVRIQNLTLHLDSGVKLADETWTIHVTMQHATNAHLLQAQPSIKGRGMVGSYWELSIPLACEEIGNADLIFTASVQVSRVNFVTQVFEATSQRCALSVRPRPRIMRVEPCIGQVRGSSLVTVHGYNLAPLSASDTLSISFNGRPCGDVAVLSSEAATCITPAADDVWNDTSTGSQGETVKPGIVQDMSGAGYVDVTVTLSDAGLLATNTSGAARYDGDHLRHGILPRAFRYVMLLIAATGEQPTTGLLSALSPKYLALGPAPINARLTELNSSGAVQTPVTTPSTYYPSRSARMVWDTGLRTSGGITALAIWRHRIIVAGTFDKEPPRIKGVTNGVQDKHLVDKAHRIVIWDGATLEPLALGLDGPVHTLATLSSMLIVGGSFFRAFQTDDSHVLKSGISRHLNFLSTHVLVHRHAGLVCMCVCNSSGCTHRWLGIVGRQSLGYSRRRSS